MGLESSVDDVISSVIVILRKRWKHFALVAIIGALIFVQPLLRFFSSQLFTIFLATRTGISRDAFASGMATGVISGLGPPGLTLTVALPIVLQIAEMLGRPVDAPVVAIAASINAALTIPDVILWTSVFAHIGSRVFPGGRYIRPFLAGAIPWLLSSPFLFFITERIALVVWGST